MRVTEPLQPVDSQPREPDYCLQMFEPNINLHRHLHKIITNNDTLSTKYSNTLFIVANIKMESLVGKFLKLFLSYCKVSDFLLKFWILTWLGGGRSGQSWQDRNELIIEISPEFNWFQFGNSDRQTEISDWLTGALCSGDVRSCLAAPASTAQYSPVLERDNLLNRIDHSIWQGFFTKVNWWLAVYPHTNTFMEKFRFCDKHNDLLEHIFVRLSGKYCSLHSRLI